VSRRDEFGHDPDSLRGLVEAYTQILSAAEVLRCKKMALRERFALATIVDEIEGKRKTCQRRLHGIEEQRHGLARAAERAAKLALTAERA
jgi:hypothetical protein